jgi:hypothetical protein
MSAFAPGVADDSATDVVGDGHDRRDPVMAAVPDSECDSLLKRSEGVSARRQDQPLFAINGLRAGPMVLIPLPLVATSCRSSDSVRPL